jgi:DNA (cytosine-5)-methyltransferase 1
VDTGDPFDLLKDRVPSFLRSLRLASVSSWAAISDLEVGRGGTQPSSETPGFDEIRYTSPLTHYQRLMGAGTVMPTDLRLARHTSEIAARFAEIIEISHADGRLNTTISKDVRERFGLKKKALRVLDPDRPFPTVTSMPDDLLYVLVRHTRAVIGHNDIIFAKIDLDFIGSCIE